MCKILTTWKTTRHTVWGNGDCRIVLFNTNYRNKRGHQTFFKLVKKVKNKEEGS